jgi:hypothetical protein
MGLEFTQGKGGLVPGRDAQIFPALGHDHHGQGGELPGRGRGPGVPAGEGGRAGGGDPGQGVELGQKLQVQGMGAVGQVQQVAQEGLQAAEATCGILALDFPRRVRDVAGGQRRGTGRRNIVTIRQATIVFNAGNKLF